MPPQPHPVIARGESPEAISQSSVGDDSFPAGTRRHMKCRPFHLSFCILFGLAFQQYGDWLVIANRLAAVKERPETCGREGGGIAS